MQSFPRTIFPCPSGPRAAKSSGPGSTTRRSTPGSCGGRSPSIASSSMASDSTPAVGRCIVPKGTSSIRGLIKKHGADAIRIFVASETNPGDDFRINEAKVGGAAKFVTTLWNVARFFSSFDEPDAGKLQPTDEWILAELNRLVESCRGAYEDLNLFLPSNRCREFLWNLFAPHYVEMVKARAYEGDTGARWTLHACLRDLVRLLAPVTPFSTDKIWRSVYGGSVHAERFPLPRDGIPASR